MSAHAPGVVRVVALVGPTGAGKTSLLDAMLSAAGARSPKTGGAGGSVGDASPEARARGHSVELNFAGFEYLDDRYAVIDCPGAVDFAAEGDLALPAVDLAVVVASPDPARAILLQPVLNQLERLGVARLIFVNRMDQARGSVADLLTALGAVSAVPVVARQLPLWSSEQVTGFVDLGLERAFAYREGGPSERISPSAEVVEVEKDARFHMLEQLADFDDELFEQLISDQTPEPERVFADLVREMNDGLIAPVMFGDSLKGFGVRRLLKALRHDAGSPVAAARRLGADGPGVYVIKTSYAGQGGKLTYARALGGAVADGAELVSPDGERNRAAGLFALQGAALRKVGQAADGEVVAIGKLEHARAGDFLSQHGAPKAVAGAVAPRPPVSGLAIAAMTRNEDVRLSVALAKLVEEDPALSLSQEPETHETILAGQSEAHLRLALERLKRRFGLDVTTGPPSTAYKETITGPVTQHARHKKQTGGHGQYGDVTVEIRPTPRGAGFEFAQRITGGVVPRQWIPAVELGVRDAMAKGPLGFPVVDVAVTLIDGGFHSVDSSEMAFRQAGRLAMEEGLRRCGPSLLEPIERVVIHVPSSSTSSVTSSLSARRGQVLGFGPREGWSGWDSVEALLPRAERHSFIGELRSVSQGLGSFEFSFDHMAEMNERMAEEITRTGDRRISG
ncbi:MAG TPA: elongation factor G [Caulobacteraceae bacterium]|nr:elongation factor G [Caulobacteraceae bacterium]